MTFTYLDGFSRASAHEGGSVAAPVGAPPLLDVDVPARSSAGADAAAQEAGPGIPAPHARLELLLEAGRVIDQPYDPSALVGALARCLVARLGGACAVHLQFPGFELPELIAVAHELAERAADIAELFRRHPPEPLDRAGICEALRTGRPALQPDPGEGRDAGHLRAARAQGLASVLVVPLRAPGVTLGTLTLLSPLERHFDATDVRVLEEVGARAGRALRAAEVPVEAAKCPTRTPPSRDRELLLLLEKEARAEAEIAVHRISTLQTVTAALSEAVTLQQVADIIVGEGVGSLGAQVGGLYLFDAAHAHLELCASRGLSAEGAQAIARIATSSAGPTRWAEPLWIPTAEEVRATFPIIEDKLGGEVVMAALAAVPLSVGGSVAGVLFLGFQAPQPFPEEERVFTLALMRHCAQAIDRARLFEAERRSNLRLLLLAKAGELLSSSIDYETTLANVARSALPALGDYCLFDVIEDEGVRRVARSSGDSVAAQIDGARFAASARLGAKPRALYAEIDDAALGGLAPSADHVPLLRRLGLRSMVTVPVMARHQTLGWLTLAFGPSGRHHGAADLEIAEELAHRAAIAVENAALHRQSREATLRAQEANRRSELANRTKDEFLGVVSHELRTPLNAVLGWSQLLRGPCASDPAVLAKGLRVIDKNARAQAKLIEDILDVSRIITGKLRLELAPLELERVLRTSLEVIRPAADAKGVELRSLVEARPTVSGDPDRLQQVVWNLLSNAVKFTPQGGRVDIILRRGRTAAEIVVEDSGRGIEPEFLPYVFERFRQADSSSTRRHGGLGLGLAIVRHLVELHGGSVRAESSGLGRGSTFTVRLPAREEDVPDNESRALLDTDPGPMTLRLDGLRLLVVDDEGDARELIAAMLGASGAEVATAGSAAEAMEKLTSFGPDVLVSDIGMPGEDGYAMIRKVRALGGKLGRIPALALTAYASPEDARKAMGAGFQTHLSKPAEPSVLTAVVASLGGRITG